MRSRYFYPAVLFFGMADLMSVFGKSGIIEFGMGLLFMSNGIIDALKNTEK